MKTFFRTAALFDWIAGLGLIFNLNMQVKMLGLESPNYPGIFTLVGGVTLIFGWIFWQVSNHPDNRPIFQAALLAKIVPTLALTGAILAGLLPKLFFPLVLLTDGVWIVPFVYFYRRTKI
ncbi:MAG: hypothetical protein HY073_02345 [Deltaproteobacteria bacterium]|nr:hypothetical protein [Deltaproteobacteria bacterium]